MGDCSHPSHTSRTDRISHRIRQSAGQPWARPILADKLADEVVGRINYDFAGLDAQTSVVCQAAHARRCSTTGSARTSTSIRMPSWSTSVSGCKLLAVAIGFFGDVNYDACAADLQYGINTVGLPEAVAAASASSRYQPSKVFTAKVWRAS
jgi:hypothetical protein